ncbi:MAG: hypothetical protein WCV63_02180 [Negativicutes bacterium]|jgi:hypothetical protein
MTTIQNAVQLVAIAFVCSVVINKILFAKWFVSQFKHRIGILICGLIFLSVRIDGASLAMCVRGLTGDISITSLVLICSMVVSEMTNINVKYKVSILHLTVMVVIGGLLYLTTFGIIPFDLCYFGYDYIYIATLLFLYAVFNLNKSVISAVVAIAIMVAFQFNLLGSRNLFDYLIDLPLWLVCSWFFVKRLSVKKQMINIENND